MAKNLTVAATRPDTVVARLESITISVMSGSIADKVHTFSPAVMASLLVALTASASVFHQLTRRWTRDRPRAAATDWAAERRFRIQWPPRAVLPVALDSLRHLDARAEITLTRGPVVLVRFSTADKNGVDRRFWNVLVRTTDVARPPAALRPVPTAAGRSVIDLFVLTAFPAILDPDRFVVMATDTPEARAMAACPARGLLPADVGLLVHGAFVTVDFSTRPFDPVEWDRMLAVTEQVARHLPV